MKPGQKTTAYAVKSNSDTTEGRGRTVTLGIYITEDLAIKASKGVGIMGSDGDVEPVAAIACNDGVIYAIGGVVRRELDADIRARALAKLTVAERTILGLK